MNERNPSISWPKKLAFAAITTAAFFAFLEVVLMLSGMDAVNQSSDPMAGFSRQVPLLENATSPDGQPILRTADRKLVWFNPQSFPAEKPTGTRRVFCVGGSTTYGRPFDDSTSYVAWLRQLLPRVDSSCRWEVINAGGVSYASYRVAAVMEELATCQPDLFIVYSAQNEFLERLTYGEMLETSQLRRDFVGLLQKTRTWALVDRVVSANTSRSDSTGTQSTLPQPPEEVDELLNHSIGPTSYQRDDDWQQKVVRHYELNLQRMIDIARDAGAQIVFVSPASNLRDCWPFKSVPSDSLDEQGIEDSAESLREIYQRLRKSDASGALALCDELLKVDPRNAEAHFLRGRAAFVLEQFDDAEISFLRAIDEDVCPLRATTQIQQTLSRVANRSDVPMVRFNELLRQRSMEEYGHACFGTEHFLDHVHPTLDVHGQLAQWIIEELQARSLISGQPPSPSDIDEIRESIDAQIDVDAQAIAFRNLAKVLHWAGKFHEAGPRARDAIRLMPTDLESRFLLADCLYNLEQFEESREQYEILFTIADYPRAYLPYGELLSLLGDLTDAKNFLTSALLTDNLEHRARAYYSLGMVHLELKEYAKAVAALEQARELYPENAATQQLLELARTQLISNQPESARGD